MYCEELHSRPDRIEVLSTADTWDEQSISVFSLFVFRYSLHVFVLTSSGHNRWEQNIFFFFFSHARVCRNEKKCQTNGKHDKRHQRVCDHRPTESAETVRFFSDKLCYRFTSKVALADEVFHLYCRKRLWLKVCCFFFPFAEHQACHNWLIVLEYQLLR